ncbi:hypothetical protein DPMN_029332 [Dreissena polymorpha]|uniref:Uncharacterized protein n=1 Tax=Dreissena polymorpha TaxID=45954 RepID=A0A9D4LW96_DREPO|nr:hypothetical protein DPMN_029332 [Dreissena polymorpha]
MSTKYLAFAIVCNQNKEGVLIVTSHNRNLRMRPSVADGENRLAKVQYRALISQ